MKPRDLVNIRAAYKTNRGLELAFFFVVEPFPSVVWINKFKSWCRTRLCTSSYRYMEMFVEVSYDGFDNGYCLKVDLWALWVGLAMGFRGTLGFGVRVERRNTQNSEICTKWLSEVVVKGLKDLPPKLFEQCWAWYFTVECGYCREISRIHTIQSPWVIAQLTSTQWSESGNLSKLALSRVWDM